MVNKNEETNKKEVSTNKKKKIRKLIIIFVISFVLLAILIALIVYILLVDKNKNSHIDNQNENTEIINKNFVDGFSNTSSDGVFSFKLPQDDVNQMLMNAYKSLGDNKISGIYYEDKGVNQYFYVDLPSRCIPTRVVVETSITNIEDYKVELSVNKVSKGKLNIINKAISKGYLTSLFVSKVSSSSLLPISYDDNNRVFKVDILSLMEYFPKGELKDSIYSLLSLNKDKCISYGDSLFSFKIDLKSLRSNLFKKSKELEAIPNIRKSLEEKAEAFDSSSVEVGKETELYSVSDETFSNIVSNEVSKNPIEKYESKLTNNVAFFKVNYVHSLIENNSIKYMFDLSISGYEVDVVVSTSLVGSYPLYRSNLRIDENVSIGTYLLDSGNNISKIFRTQLVNIFTSMSNKYDYFTFSSETKIYGFDFSSISTSKYRPELMYKNISLENGKLSFLVQKIL